MGNELPQPDKMPLVVRHMAAGIAEWLEDIYQTQPSTIENQNCWHDNSANVVAGGKISTEKHGRATCDIKATP